MNISMLRGNFFFRMLVETVIVLMGVAIGTCMPAIKDFKIYREKRKRRNL